MAGSAAVRCARVGVASGFVSLLFRRSEYPAKSEKERCDKDRTEDCNVCPPLYYPIAVHLQSRESVVPIRVAPVYGRPEDAVAAANNLTFLVKPAFGGYAPKDFDAITVVRA